MLKQLNIDYKFVSRTASNNADYTYTDLNQELINNHQIIINCTPVGTYPKVDQAPDIPYQFITSNHILYDLIYNPSTTLFLQEGKNKGATIINGYDMLVFQAEKAWKIWNK